MNFLLYLHGNQLNNSQNCELLKFWYSWEIFKNKLFKKFPKSLTSLSIQWNTVAPLAPGPTRIKNFTFQLILATLGPRIQKLCSFKIERDICQRVFTRQRQLLAFWNLLSVYYLKYKYAMQKLLIHTKTVFLFWKFENLDNSSYPFDENVL